MTTTIHPDDIAVDNFAAAMKLKLAAAREKGRCGWSNTVACSTYHLANLLVGHLTKGNEGTFEDIANFAMMMHQRGDDPAILASIAKQPVTEALALGIAAIESKTNQLGISCPCCHGSGRVGELSDGMTLLGRRINELTAELHSVKTMRDALTGTCGLQEQNISRLNEEIRKATQEISALKSHVEAMRGAMTNAVNVIDLIPEGQAAAVYQMEAVLRAGPKHHLAAHDAEVAKAGFHAGYQSAWSEAFGIEKPQFLSEHKANEYANQLVAKAGA